MDTVRSVEESLAQDVDALRDQFTETQTLYREVCALLFFRYGMTPTANKLYQLVRKGSMSAPAQALAQFWTDLREKSRNRVEHPDLPPEFQALGGELVARLWEAAQRAANESLTAYREEAAQTVKLAQDEIQALQTECADKQGQIVIRDGELAQAQDAIMSLKGDVSGLRAQCASLAALREKEREESQLQKLKLEGRLEESQQAFASELSGLRAAMQLAEERSRSNEKRVLLELDRERMTATRLQKQLETVQSRSSQELKQSQEKLTQTHQELVESREKSGKLELQLELTRERLETTYRETLELRQSLSEVQDDARNAHASLREARQQIARQQQERQLQTDSGQRHKQAQRAMRRVVRGTRSESMRDRFDKRRDV